MGGFALSGTEQGNGKLVAQGSSGIEPTEREKEVAQLLAYGCSQKTIAKMLRIDIDTVGVHVYRLAQKIPGKGSPMLKAAVWYMRANDEV